MRDHGFPKGDVSIQTPVVGDFIVLPHKNFHGTQSPLYHGFDFLAHFRYRLLYLSLFCIYYAFSVDKSKPYYNYMWVFTKKV